MRILKALSAVVLLAGLSALWGCDKDKPTQPTEPKDYYIYFASEVSEYQYFRYHTGTGVIDSFPAPYSTFESGFGISPDGKTMYIRPRGEGIIVEMSLDSHVVVAEHPIAIKEHSSQGRLQKVIISPNSRYIAIINYYLHIYDLSDFSVIYRDTINSIGKGNFYQNGDVFFCPTHDNDLDEFYALKINLADGCAETKWRIYGPPYRVIPDASYEKLFLYLHVYDELYLFQAYDIASDSIIFSKSLCPGNGDMEITLDGRYIIFSQPGSWIVGVCPPPRYFTIFDIEGNCIDREVDAFVDSLGIVHATNDLCLTPDGRHLIGIGLQVNGLFDYDMQRHEFNRHVVTGGIRYMFSLTCQAKR